MSYLSHPLSTVSTAYPKGKRTFGPSKPWGPPAYQMNEVILIVFGNLQPIALTAQVYATNKVLSGGRGFSKSTIEMVEMQSEWTDLACLAEDPKAKLLFEDIRMINAQTPSIGVIKPPYVVTRIIRVLNLTREQLIKGSPWRQSAENVANEYWSEYDKHLKETEEIKKQQEAYEDGFLHDFLLGKTIAEDYANFTDWDVSFLSDNE